MQDSFRPYRRSSLQDSFITYKRSSLQDSFRPYRRRVLSPIRGVLCRIVFAPIEEVLCILPSTHTIPYNNLKWEGIIDRWMKSIPNQRTLHNNGSLCRPPTLRVKSCTIIYTTSQEQSQERSSLVDYFVKIDWLQEQREEKGLTCFIQVYSANNYIFLSNL